MQGQGHRVTYGLFGRRSASLDDGPGGMGVRLKRGLLKHELGRECLLGGLGLRSFAAIWHVHSDHATWLAGLGHQFGFLGHRHSLP